MTPFDSTESGFRDMPLFDAPAPPASVGQAARHHRLRTRFLRAGRDAVDDRELLELLLSVCGAVPDARALAGTLLDLFGTASCVLAARPERLRTVPGLSDTGVALIKTAEALGIRLARAEVPNEVRPSFENYRKVLDYCRTLAGHREVEEFHLLLLDRRNRLLRDELHQRGTVTHTPAYPREICIRCLETRATAILLLHNHPSGSLQPSQADIEMTRRIRDALKPIEVTVHDHVIVTSGDAFSFRDQGLL